MEYHQRYTNSPNTAALSHIERLSSDNYAEIGQVRRGNALESDRAVSHVEVQLPEELSREREQALADSRQDVAAAFRDASAVQELTPQLEMVDMTGLSPAMQETITDVRSHWRWYDDSNRIEPDMQHFDARANETYAAGYDAIAAILSTEEIAQLRDGDDITPRITEVEQRITQLQEQHNNAKHDAQRTKLERVIAQQHAMRRTLIDARMGSLKPDATQQAITQKLMQADKMIIEQNYRYMPEIYTGVKKFLDQRLELLRQTEDPSEKLQLFASYQHTERLVDDVPSELYDEFDEAVLAEAFHFAATDHAANGVSDNDLRRMRYDVGATLAARGFEPQHWVKCAENDPACPEYIREYIDQREEDKLDALTLDYIDGVAERLPDSQDDKVLAMFEEFYHDRLPDMPQQAIQDYIGDVADSAQYEFEPMGVFKRYLDTVRTIGQDKARQLYETTGVVHFSGWSPRVLEGTYNLLAKGYPESGDDVTVMVKGTTGDHNNAFERMRYIESDDVIAAEVGNAGDLVRLTGVLQRVGLDRHVQQIVLAGHGEEEQFALSATDHIAADADSWAENTGISTMVKTLQPENFVLIACHPLVHEGGGFAAIDDTPQLRQGTAPAISEAFPKLNIISGMDGPVTIDERTDGHFGLKTVAIKQADIDKLNDDTPTHPHLALTRNGKTRRYPHNHITV